MLAQTPQLIFHEIADFAPTPRELISPFYDVDGSYLARFTWVQSTQPPDGASILAFDQQSGTASRIFGIPSAPPESTVQFKDALYLFYDVSPFMPSPDPSSLGLGKRFGKSVRREWSK